MQHYVFNNFRMVLILRVHSRMGTVRHHKVAGIYLSHSWWEGQSLVPLPFWGRYVGAVPRGSRQKLQMLEWTKRHMERGKEKGGALVCSGFP